MRNGDGSRAVLWLHGRRRVARLGVRAQSILGCEIMPSISTPPNWGKRPLGGGFDYFLFYSNCLFGGAQLMLITSSSK